MTIEIKAALMCQDRINRAFERSDKGDNERNRRELNDYIEKFTEQGREVTVREYQSNGLTKVSYLTIDGELYSY